MSWESGSALAIVLLLGVTQACGGEAGTKSEQSPLVTATGNVPSSAALGDCSEERIASSSDYSLDAMSAGISGKVLTVSVLPIGGCDGDTFYACWPPIFRTSDPAGALVNVVRKGSQVSCTTTPKSKVLSIDLDG